MRAQRNPVRSSPPFGTLNNRFGFGAVCAPWTLLYMPFATLLSIMLKALMNVSYQIIATPCGRGPVISRLKVAAVMGALVLASETATK
jgi:hypothetical protein